MLNFRQILAQTTKRLLFKENHLFKLQRQIYFLTTVSKSDVWAQLNVFQMETVQTVVRLWHKQKLLWDPEVPPEGSGDDHRPAGWSSMNKQQGSISASLIKWTCSKQTHMGITLAGSKTFTIKQSEKQLHALVHIFSTSGKCLLFTRSTHLAVIKSTFTYEMRILWETTFSDSKVALEKYCGLLHLPQTLSCFVFCSRNNLKFDLCMKKQTKIAVSDSASSHQD